jgi:predicted ABC-type ATPase
MSKQLDDAIEHLTTTYQSLAQAAAGYINTLDAKEVAAALKKAKPDTAEYVALEQLNNLMQLKNTAPVEVINETVVTDTETHTE